MHNKVLIIVPAYNEESNIQNVIDKLRNFGYDFIIINDCSSDGTLDVLKKNRVNYISLPVNLGIGGAVQTGYKYAYRNGYDIAVQVDGDGQHNPKYIKDLITAVSSGYNMVIGSRYIENIGYTSTAARKMGKGVLSFLIRAFLHSKITDPTSGFRACDRNVLKIFQKDYPFEYPEPETIVQIAKKKYRIKEIPVAMNERTGGNSSITPLKSVYYMIEVCLSIIIKFIER